MEGSACPDVISTANNFIFIHIPKTGGNSLQLLLEPYSDDRRCKTQPFHDLQERFDVIGDVTRHKHFTAAEYINVIGMQKFMSMRKIAFVRNPFHRAMSFYFSPFRWLKSTGNTGAEPAYEFKKSDFLSFIENIPIATSYVSYNNELIGFDFIGRYENFATDARLALRLCRIPESEAASLPRINAGYDQKLDFYDDETIDAVRRIFHLDFVNFGYEFDFR